MSETKDFKVIIVGSGPAGYTAGIYLGRANIPHLLFEGEQPGGQLTITTEVENYPAFPEGIDGPELMTKFRAQSERFGTVIKGETVKSIDMANHPFKVTTNAGQYVAPAVIIAAGSTARWLNLPHEEDYYGKGLSACATCDGFFFRDQDVAVVGGGDTALEEATFLTNFANKVTLIHRRDELRGSKIMQDRALNNPKIEMAWNSVIDSYIPDENGNLKALKLNDAQTPRGDALGEEIDVRDALVTVQYRPPHRRMFDSPLPENVPTLLSLLEVGALVPDRIRRTSPRSLSRLVVPAARGNQVTPGYKSLRLAPLLTPERRRRAQC